MEFALSNQDKIRRMYVDEGKSSYEIAEALGTYSTRVLRAMKYLGIEKRSSAEAQKAALSSGRSSHPTKGKSISESHRKNIGKSRSEAYKKMTPEDKLKMIQMGKDTWAALPDSKKAEIRQLALESIRESSKKGSKTERHILNGLQKEGYAVEFHKTNLIPGSKLEVDMFIPEARTALEIDGPSHFLPLWGEEKLIKQQNADNIKQGILISAGYSILRIKQMDKSISLTNMNNLLDIVLSTLKTLQSKKKNSKNTLIEIEVKDGQAKRI